MWGAVIAQAAKMIVGGVVSGVTAYRANSDKVASYEQAAKDVEAAAEKYSGATLNNNMFQAGVANAASRNAKSYGAAQSNFNGNSSSGMANWNKMNQNIKNADATTEGYNQGANREKTMANALYNKDTASAQQAMNQADINYNVTNQTGQAISNGIGSLADLAGTIGSGK